MMQGSKMTEEPEGAKVEKEDRRKAGAKGQSSRDDHGKERS